MREPFSHPAQVIPVAAREDGQPQCARCESEIGVDDIGMLVRSDSANPFLPWCFPCTIRLFADAVCFNLTV